MMVVTPETPTDQRVLDAATRAAAEAAIRDAKSGGWDQARLAAYFRERGVSAATYQAAVSGTPVSEAVAGAIVQISITGLPDVLPSNVTPVVPAPSADDMLAQVTHLFGDLPANLEGLVEIAWTSPAAPHPLNSAKLFDCGDLEEIVAEIGARSVCPSQNLYLSAGIRRPDADRNKRASAADVTHLVAVWADFDDEGAAAKARETVKEWGLQPTLVVQTASRPHQRVQFWWKLDEPTTELVTASGLITTLAQLLGGDRAVSNPDRVMRAAGGVAWPLKKGRSLESVQILADWAPQRQPYRFEDIVRIVAERAATTAPVVRIADVFDFNRNAEGRRSQAERLAAIDTPGEWHNSVRDWIASQVQRHGTTVEALVEMAPRLMQPGFSLLDTEQEIRVMAEGAWRKYAPAQSGEDANEHAPQIDGEGDAIDPTTGEVIGGPLLNLWARHIAPSFPVELLPPVLRDYVEYLSISMGVDPGACAMSALAACSGALDQSIRLKMKRFGDWYARPRLWVLLIGDPSAKKTPIITSCTRPLRLIEAKIGKVWSQDMARWKAMDKKERGDPPPAPTQYIFNNATVESIADVLITQERGALYETDEFASWLGGMEKYGSGKSSSADRGFWAQAFNGGPLTINRVTKGGRMFIQNLCMAFIGAIQPDKLDEIMGLTSDGLLQRFLPVLMQDGQWPEDVHSDAPAEAYEALVTRLANTRPSLMLMDEGAYAAAEEFRRYIFDLQRIQGLGKGFCTFVGKLDGLHGSLALVLHMTGHPGGPFEAILNGGPVSEQTVRAATKIMEEFVIRHAMIFYRTGPAPGSDWEGLRSIASWVLRSDKVRFTRSDFTTSVDCLRGLKQYEVDQRVSPLVAGGWLDEEAVNGVVKAWKIRPHVRLVLSKRREIEKANAAAALEKLHRHLKTEE